MDTPTKIPAPEKEAGTLRLILTLGIAGFISGLVLVSIFLYTQPAIQQHRARALEEAIFKVLPGCVRYQTLELQGEKLATVEDGQESNDQDEVLPRVYAGYDEQDQLIGFAIQGEEPGFQDIISAIFGYEPGEKVIIGFEVLESKETPGLGDKILKDKEWRANFERLAVEPSLAVVKKGAKQKPNEVEAITGATISSKAVVRLLDNELDRWKAVLEQYMKTSQQTQAHE